ncbi:SCO2322 family protein [Streptomyces sp. NPDC089919]|uniref:SCO2322 family protein n=1 Tax=Streptomyces sp. NPDC089919 TaxID=3155188 RepID=UPI0034380A72
MRTRLAALALALGTFLTVLGAGPALATGYRYWSFWQGGGADNTWVYAGEGPSTARPVDGAVEGFRFAVSADSKDAHQPRRPADFQAVCGDTPAVPGKKRVALVIDFGVPADAPGSEQPPALRTACASVDPAASAAEALAAVAKPLRYDSAAMLCAISGYPKQGCGEQVTASEPKAEGTPAPQGSAAASAGTDAGATPGTDSAADSASDSGSTSLGLVAGIALVLALGGAALWQVRRRRVR